MVAARPSTPLARRAQLGSRRGAGRSAVGRASRSARVEWEEGGLNVAVLLSGGVDSSVALHRAVSAGNHCTAFYLQIWFQEDFENFWGECPWQEDLRYVRAVCEQLRVPLEVVPLTTEYWERVVAHTIQEYRSGRTPNPDVLCNSRVKFGAFFDAKLGGQNDEGDDGIDVGNTFDCVISGHYARSRFDDASGKRVLCPSVDALKDQTYFLSGLSQSQLQMARFPIGDMTKAEVRAAAAAAALPTSTRKDSQGICFLGKVRFSDFVRQHLGSKEGLLVEAETGQILGRHEGFWFYTVGQRKGIKLSGGPWYVVAKDVDENVVFVSREYRESKHRRNEFACDNLNWIAERAPIRAGADQLLCRVKVRHGPESYPCTLKLNEEGNIASVKLAKDDQGLAAGQFAAFYHEGDCLGSGIIQERGIPNWVGRVGEASSEEIFQ